MLGHGSDQDELFCRSTELFHRVWEPVGYTGVRSAVVAGVIDGFVVGATVEASVREKDACRFGF